MNNCENGEQRLNSVKNCGKQWEQQFKKKVKNTRKLWSAVKNINKGKKKMGENRKQNRKKKNNERKKLGIIVKNFKYWTMVKSCKQLWKTVKIKTVKNNWKNMWVWWKQWIRWGEVGVGERCGVGERGLGG